MIELYDSLLFMVIELIFSLCFIITFSIGFLMVFNTHISNTKFKKLLIYFFTILIVVSIQISIKKMIVHNRDIISLVLINSVIYVVGTLFSSRLVKSKLINMFK